MIAPLPPLAGWPAQTSFVFKPSENYQKKEIRKRKARRISGRHYRKEAKR